MVIMNDDTFEEVVTFKLTRMSVYIMLSTLFLLLTGLTIAVVSFTDLRFLIPGYGKQGALQELRALKMKTDSMEQVMRYNEQYFTDLQKVFGGNELKEKLDTNILKIPKIENEYQ